MYGYTNPPYDPGPYVWTWDVLEHGPGAPRCGECNKEVELFSTDGNTTLACPNCGVSAKMNTTSLNHHFIRHHRVTFPIRRPLRGY